MYHKTQEKQPRTHKKHDIDTNMDVNIYAQFARMCLYIS